MPLAQNHAENPTRRPRRKVSAEELAEALKNPDYLLVIHKAIRRHGRTLDEDTCWSYAREALWRALSFVDPDHPNPMKLTTAIYRFVRNRLINFSQKEQNRKATEADSHTRDLDTPHTRVTERLKEVLPLVPDGFRELLIRHYLDGVPLSDIARETGQTTSHLSDKLKTALHVARQAASWCI